jgi:hypothetical protein
MIEYINDTDLDDLTPAILGTLRCGHDKFSRLRLHKLVSLIDAETIFLVHAALPDAASRAAAMRWVLRGLEPTRSILKVTHDIERTEQVRAARHDEKVLAAEIAECIG